MSALFQELERQRGIATSTYWAIPINKHTPPVDEMFSILTPLDILYIIYYPLDISMTTPPGCRHLLSIRSKPHFTFT